MARSRWRKHVGTAGEWRSLIAKGIDPAVEKANREKEAREASLRVKHSFAAVAETFIADKLAQERDGKDAERVLRTNFVAAWADRPIGDITALDVLEIINRTKRRAPQQARALMVLIRRFFNWACDAHVYGLDRSPCDRLSVSRIIGPEPKRNRRLSDAEIFAFWRATERMKYPVGSVYQMLLLTGLRLNECAQLSWPEVQGDLITIPASRMKAKIMVRRRLRDRAAGRDHFPQNRGPPAGYRAETTTLEATHAKEASNEQVGDPGD
jgi:integrase